LFFIDTGEANHIQLFIFTSKENSSTHSGAYSPGFPALAQHLKEEPANAASTPTGCQTAFKNVLLAWD